jgi:hypothetical protein
MKPKKNKPDIMKLTNPKNGEVLTSRFTSHASARQTLGIRITSGDLQGNKFAASIHKSTDTEDGRTVGRVFWLHKLAGDTKAEAKPLPKIKLAGLVAMLVNAAASKLKRPSILLTTPDGVEVKLTIAGERSRYTGAVMIASATFRGPYYGRVMPDGKFFAGRDFTDEIGEMLNAMSADPKGSAAAQGHLTGRCCFCRKMLSDDKSIKLGYGPVCAKKFGLSHTRKQATKVARYASGDLFTGVGKVRRKVRRVKVVPSENETAMSELLGNEPKPKSKARRIVRRSIEGV